jgi:hypothetical protein
MKAALSSYVGKLISSWCSCLKKKLFTNVSTSKEAKHMLCILTVHWKHYKVKGICVNK